MDAKIKRDSFYIGLVGAFLTAGIYIYMWQAQDYLNAGLNTSLYLYPIIFGVAAQIWGRKIMQGKIAFKQTVLAYFICIVLIFFTESITHYILLNHINPEAKDILLEAWKGVGEQQKGLARDQVFKAPTFSLSEFALGFATKTMIFTVVGLITGLFVSKIPQR
ncbi:DUF4199 family protein [Nonlabens xiamenensis]|uniref:DUF4199 family protein n=1 Tax=Nonlabens xiamenensis TaxID=2341043 RepID=UPI000F60F7B3|nr:DUF4199 family protein [Nonlabens xiamenensis]